MKARLLGIWCLLLGLAAFGQGKVAFMNDSAHLVMFAGATYSPDYYLGFSPVPASPLPSGVTLVASLYAGTTPNALSLQATTEIGNPSAGRLTPKLVILDGIPGGQIAYFDIIVHEASDTDPINHPGWGYWGRSGQFTAIPGFSLSYPSLLPGGPSESTWAAGDIYLVSIPEPSSVALGVVGFLVLGWGRRQIWLRGAVGT